MIDYGDLEHKSFEDEDRRDSLSPARGIILGLPISGGIWVLGLGFLYLLYRLI